jgi:hypothetical protein
MDCLTKTNIMGLALAFAVFAAARLAYTATKSASSPFHFYDFFMENGRASFSRGAAFVALVISSWGFVSLTLSNTLSEWYYTPYMGIWAAAQIGNKWLDRAYAAKKEGGTP